MTADSWPSGAGADEATTVRRPSAEAPTPAELGDRWQEIGGQPNDPAELWTLFMDSTRERVAGCDPDRDGDRLLFQASPVSDTPGRYSLSFQRQLFAETREHEYEGMTSFGYALEYELDEPDMPPSIKQWGNAGRTR